MYFLILPNQLFNVKYLEKSFTYIIWECPHYFTGYNYNKKKLLLHRASMKYYYDYLIDNNIKVFYYNFNDKLDEKIEYTLYNPLNKINILKLPKNYKIYNKSTPSLLLSNELLLNYRNKTKKFFFNAFYMWSKKQLNIIPNVKSQDSKNRNKLKEKIIIKQPFILYDNDNKYVKEAIIYVNKNFKNNYGDTNNFIFPVSHDDADKWLNHFINYKFKLFGDYQDFIDTSDNYLYHSLLSSLINIGLLCPNDIINKLTKIKNKIPINSYEGFIRQLFWREYQYYCYLYYDFNNKNYFNNKNKLNSKWYSGNIGILPVDDAIKEAFSTGYLHHIKRLMVIGNYMNLCRIHPKEGFKWFMEFSCDSYEWVMHQNVYEMVFFISGGDTMRRPYISSSNYIINMSNYKKDKWCNIWDKKYREFVIKNKNKLWKYRYYFSNLLTVKNST